MPPRPFRIDVPDSVLEDLSRRLDNTRWPDAVPGTDWDYGADVNYIRELVAYWRHAYDWRAHEAALNSWPQFLSEVDGVDIQYWHVKGKGPKPHPLLLTHGWPGSMFEFFHLIGPLTDPAAYGGDPRDAFDVVIPSIPGFGWSGKPREGGWGPSRVADALNYLMNVELGYEVYGAQGGDWGAIVSTRMGVSHSDNLSGIHLNFVIATPPAEPTEEDQAGLSSMRAFQANETGYSNVQGTKPQSLGIAQADSPAGIAAWISEKFRTWSDCNGNLESRFSKDTLLTNIMFYWAPNSIASAARIYYEARAEGGNGSTPSFVPTPTGVAVFPKEVWMTPRSWVERSYNLLHWTEMPEGGHFAALEQPDRLLDDIRTFFRQVR
ncbi:MAG: multidrug MFS transporter [Dehalococcoidia bacterium]|nr:multidrug MFS transporter [Dehalococcoidia bacterium]|tara:strand:- start:236 stop:1369 length:1134 start_codon:yes stop_codon:yes gene_type:complete